MQPFIPIPISELPLNVALGFDLYLTYNKKFVLFRGKNLPVDEGVLNQLRDNGIERIFVQKRDYSKYLQILYRAEGFKGDNNNLRYLQERFIPIDSRTLKVGSNPPFMVFNVEEDLPNPIIAPDIPGLIATVPADFSSSNERFYLFKKDLNSYSQYLTEVWADSAAFSPMNLAGGFLVREGAKMAAHGLFHNPNLKEAMKRANESVHGVLDRMMDNPETYYTLLKVSDQDFNTYIHSVNVAVLAMGIGAEMKLSEREIHHLGMGGLLHDVGKRFIDRDLLVKKGQVSSHEYEQLMEHVQLGKKFCEEQENMPQSVINIVAQHHERLDGSGYPDGLSADHLDPLGQILALMEIYDALTNRQPFRDAFTPFQALEKMRKIGRAINQEFLNVFIRLLGNQRKEP